MDCASTETNKPSSSKNPFSLAIAKGEVTGSTAVNKWGNSPDFDDSDGEVYVWDAAEDGTAWENMTYTFSTTAAIDSISSTNAGDTQDKWSNQSCVKH